MLLGNQNQSPQPIQKRPSMTVDSVTIALRSVESLFLIESLLPLKLRPFNQQSKRPPGWAAKCFQGIARGKSEWVSGATFISTP